jgi:hypothetical protein
MGSAGGGRLGTTNPLIALRAHDELSGRIGRKSSIERNDLECGKTTRKTTRKRTGKRKNRNRE